MELKMIPKQENIPSFDSNAIAVKYIEYYPDGEYNWLEAVSDRKWR